MVEEDPTWGAAAPRDRDNSTRILRWAAVATLAGAFLVYDSVDASPRQSVSQPRPAVSSPAPSPPTQVRGPALPRSEPVHLAIPALGVEAPFTELTLNENGQLNAPPRDHNNLVGWFRDGASPGERGNAIVAGHVDTTTGPAVFWPLSALSAGQQVVITRTDGIVASFVVDEVSTYPKDDFPDDRVYGETANAQLRLITCGGSYDREANDYTANVVVFAHLESFHWT